MNPSLLVASALVAAIFCGHTHAQTSSPPMPNGRLLASNCFQCHGTNGRGPGFETLAGRSASWLYSELRDFRDGDDNDEIMTRVARGFTDAQLRAIATYLSSLPAPVNSR